MAEPLSEEEVKDEATTSDPESAKKKGTFIYYPTHPLNITVYLLIVVRSSVIG